ncbi:MAG: 50S ribosomal protein L3 [Patescibacteria group bacterium]|nr:50S ribosomal protein L3 [Patescibacteria group bacterium]MDD4304609.1 50S ribosomal protein L3 [Patescibacteria group bacterium]MDD4695536.1 50S ribosomal protein L3 [Patescibacteria group bacterium]
MNFILGKKIKMTQIFTPEGKVIPVTEISVEPNTILRVKSLEKDGYSAIVLAAGNKKKVKKSILGLFKNFGKFRYVKEFRIDDPKDLKPGDIIGLTSFEEGQKVKAIAISKGKGFQGPVKRHGFHGTDEQHGNKDQSRMPGSIGATGPAHVFKGTRMAGRMGGDRVTIAGLEIMKIDLENNILYLKGAIAGGSNALVHIVGTGDIKLYEKPIIKEEIVEETILTQEEVVSENTDIISDENIEKEKQPEISSEEVATVITEEEKVIVEPDLKVEEQDNSNENK